MNANTSSNWNDFNDAEAQHGAFDLIPKGTIVPLRMTIKPGGHDDQSQGWTGGYATESFETGAVYLACEFVVTSGPFAKRKMWSNVGLHSKKGPTWGKDYAALMGGVPKGMAAGGNFGAPAQAAPTFVAPAHSAQAAVSGKPAWAQ